METKLNAKPEQDQNIYTDCHYIKGSEQGKQVPKGQERERTKGLDLRPSNKGR